MPKKDQFASAPEYGSKDPGFECAIYARFSDDKQRESSIEDQVRECRADAKRWGGFIPDANIFADRDVRGALEHRPQLDRLLDITRSGRATFSDLFSADTSRLARNSALAPKLRQIFKHHNIRLHFVENGMKSGTSGFELQHTFQGYIDEQYSEQLGEKVMRGQVGCVLKGYTPSGKCYGYRNANDEHPTNIAMYGRPEILGVRKVIYEVEAEIVRQIFQMYARGEGGYTYITQCLNERGVLSPRKAQKNVVRGWNHAAVRNILDNERYRGRVIFGRMKTTRDPETGKIKHRKRPESEWTIHDDPSLQIISDELWEAVKARRALVCEKAGWTKTGGMSRSRASRAYLFSGLLRCGTCGGTMVMANGPGGSYHCSSARRKTGCQNKQKVRRESLERYLIDHIAVTIRSDVNFAEIKDLFMAELSAELKRQEQAVEGATCQKDALLDERNRLMIELENLAEEIAAYGGSETLRSMIRRKEDRMKTVTDLIGRGQVPARRVSGEEVDAFLRQAFDELSSILLGEPLRSKQELQKRISSLILTPYMHEGQSAYRISGDLALFSGQEAVLLTHSVHNTSEQHNLAIKLDGILLILDARGAVVEVAQTRPQATEEKVLPEAA
ncbi:MAG: recombinase family protein [Acidobacteriaceae bacterium]